MYRTCVYFDEPVTEAVDMHSKRIFSIVLILYLILDLVDTTFEQLIETTSVVHAAYRAKGQFAEKLVGECRRGWRNGGTQDEIAWDEITYLI